MSFVAPPPSSPNPPIADAIAGDGWYPALSIRAFRASARIGATVTDERVRQALLGGYLSAETELASWRARQELAGVTALAALPGSMIGGEPRALVLWRRSVHAFAAADLAETHTDVTATDEGRRRVEERAAGAPDLLRAATLAIRDLLGLQRSTVRLL